MVSPLGPEPKDVRFVLHRDCVRIACQVEVTPPLTPILNNAYMRTEWALRVTFCCGIVVDFRRLDTLKLRRRRSGGSNSATCLHDCLHVLSPLGQTPVRAHSHKLHRLISFS